jgi:hypothetical protein
MDKTELEDRNKQDVLHPPVVSEVFEKLMFVEVSRVIAA